MSDFEIMNLPDGSFDLLYGDELIGNYSSHHAALRAARDLEGEMV